MVVKFFFYFFIITFDCVNAFASLRYTEVLNDSRINPHKFVDLVYEKTGYIFQNSSLLRDVFTHHSDDPNSRFRQLEFLGDTVINAVVGINTFSISKDLESLHNNMKEKINNKFLATQFKKLGLSQFVKANPNSDRETIAADAFEALIGAMQLDFSDNGNDQISPEAIKLIVRVLGINSSNSSQVVNRSRTLYTKENTLINRKSSHHAGDASLLVAGVIGAGVATLAKGLWDSFSSDPDYYKRFKFHEQQHEFHKSQHEFHKRQHAFYKKAFFGLCCLTGFISFYIIYY